MQFQSNRVETFAKLCFRKKLLDVQSDQVDIPLHTAINYGKEEVAEYLVECSRVDITFINDRGQNALHLACVKGQLK